MRPVKTGLHVMSLSVLNEHTTVPPDERERLDQGWAVVRVTRGVGEHYGPEQLSRFYTALGTRIHLGGRDWAGTRSPPPWPMSVCRPTWSSSATPATTTTRSGPSTGRP